nr:PAS domain-containing protein [Fodinibius halophilus]
MHEITSQSDRSIPQQLEKALEVTCGLLDLDIGIISHIEGQQYTIAHSWSEENILEEGQVFPLGETYCSITLAVKNVVAIDNINRSLHKRHPCHQVFGMESYIGIPLTKEGEVYGTLNFSSSEVRAEKFSELDKGFILLLGDWVSDTLHKKEMQEKLKEREELYEVVTVNETDMVCLHDPNGTYRFVSPSAEKILGYTPAELVGRNAYELFHPHDLKDIRNRSHQSAREGRQVKNFEYRIRKKNGDYIWFETSTEPITDERGKVVQLQTSSRDVTKRKKLEMLFKESQRLSSTGGWQYNLETEKLFWTEEVYRIHELPVDREITVDEAISYYHESAQPKIREGLREAIDKGEGYDVELPLVTAKGNKRWVRAIGKVQTNEMGEVYQLYGVFQDLTHRKRMEDELRDRNQELKKLHETNSKIYSVIGHDLKTPLSSIVGFADLLIADADRYDESEELKESLEIIHQSSVNTASLLEDLLDWARFQDGDLSLDIKEFPIATAIKQVVNLLRVSANRKDVTFIFENNDADKTVLGDRQVITTVVRNLLSNALKFSHRGGEVTISLASDDDYWHVKVKDEGQGMSKEVQDQLFRDETNESQTGTAGEKGTGIGLRLCKDLVESHDGMLDFDSELGEGTTFVLSIPFASLVYDKVS